MGREGEARPNRASAVDVGHRGGGVLHDSAFEIQLNSQIRITNAGVVAHTAGISHPVCDQSRGEGDF